MGTDSAGLLSVTKVPRPTWGRISWDSIAPVLGMSYGGRLLILPGQQAAEEFSTLVHELAHDMLHKAERRTATTNTGYAKAFDPHKHIRG